MILLLLSLGSGYAPRLKERFNKEEECGERMKEGNEGPIEVEPNGELLVQPRIPPPLPSLFFLYLKP